MIKRISIFSMVAMAILLALPSTGWTAERQALRGHVPVAAARLHPTGRLSTSKQLKLAIGLPLHNKEALTNLLEQICDPTSANYRHYLTPEQFTEMFGPTKAEYQAVIAFARTNGLTVTGTHPNRMLVDVNGSVADIERAFQVTLQVYQHPRETRTFYAPNVEPSVKAGVPVLDINGLNNYIVPRPKFHRRNPNNSATNAVTKVGSGPGGNGYMGSDFRTAYIPGVTNTGVGQAVALVEFDGYYANDIYMYETNAHLSTAIPITPVLLDGFDGVPSTGSNSGNGEVALDIEMAISMAPELSAVYVYEEGYPADADTANILLNRIATDNAASQISCSWIVPINETSDNIFQEYALQGQSFFDASGDDGAYLGDVPPPSDDPYLTQVGGTTLTTSGAGGHWSSETTWNLGRNIASSGGVSDIYPMPSWQQGINMTGTKGSRTMRNFPDVAMVADSIFIVADDGQLESTGGTSCAAPLWAGFAALVNQQAAVDGMPAIGFLNPALYRIGTDSAYGSSFHDITTGNNTNLFCPSEFTAVAGYDLCTGLGTPIGSNLFKALLAPVDDLQITPSSCFYAAGPAGGPFNITTQNFVLTNSGVSSLNWTNFKTAAWLNVSINNSTLSSGGTANVTVSLNSAASNLVAGVYNASVWFTNLSSHLGQRRQFALQVGQPLVPNGGFETGDFSYWILSGDIGTYNFADNGSLTTITPHSGKFFAALGQSNLPIATLSQTLPTLPGRYYSLSFWLKNPDLGHGTVPNEFSVAWDGNTLFDRFGLPTSSIWTNMQFLVKATTTATALQFGFRNDRSDFGLDDITATLVPEMPPVLAITAPKAGLNVSNDDCIVTGTARDNVGVAAVSYQLNGGSWMSVDTTNSWTNWSAEVSLTPGTNIIKAYAVDVSGNFSPTSTVSFFYVVTTVMTVQTNGRGSVNPIYNGKLLEIGKSYSMTATAAAGFGFAGWSGSFTSNKAALSFMMEPGLALTANFVDVQKPTLSISSPTSNLQVSNANFTITGKAADNVAVTGVQYQLNGSDWSSVVTTNNWTNWNAGVSLTPGTNIVRVYAVDSTGNFSATNTVSFFYVVTTVMTVQTNGRGSVSPNYNGKLLEIGRSYSMTATAVPGFKFAGWTGSLNVTNAALSFLMEPALALTANFVDVQKPTLSISSPTSNLQVSNSNFTITGKAADNVYVAAVQYQLNGSSWAPAVSTNNWTNWSAGISLTPGTNIVRACAVDTAGNVSPTNTVSFFYVVTTLMTVQTNGPGTVSPNYNGKLLEIGKNYTMTATAAVGFGFAGWTGSLPSSKAALTFMMESNLTLTAKFVDVQKPTVTIIAPVSGQKVSNSVFQVVGKTSDNVSVAGVFYEINGLGWNPVNTVNGWTNWTANVTLIPGTNTIQVYAVDNSGNDSVTAIAKLDYAVVSDWAPDALAGMTGQVTPGSGTALSISFSTETFSLTGTDTNTDNYGVGIYTYLKTGTNTAQLLATNTAPPIVASNVINVDFTFTGANSGTFSNNVSGDTGTIKFANATGHVPGSVRSLTFTPKSGGAIVAVTLNDDLTFATSENPSGTGNYTMTQYSPTVALLQLNYTDSAYNGTVNYLELTFSTAAAGAFFITNYDNQGDPPNFGDGTFTSP